MSHRNLPDATRRPTPRLGTSPRPCSRCAHRWLPWRLPKSPLLPPRRDAWRLGQGVRRRTRRTTKTSPTAENQAGNQGEVGPGSGAGKRSVNHLGQAAVPAWLLHEASQLITVQQSIVRPTQQFAKHGRRPSLHSWARSSAGIEVMTTEQTDAFEAPQRDPARWRVGVVRRHVHVRGHSVETELVALDVLHHEARLVVAIGSQ